MNTPTSLSGTFTMLLQGGFTIGMSGFEPLALWIQTRCASRLRYIPKKPCANGWASRLFSRLALRNNRPFYCSYVEQLPTRTVSIALTWGSMRLLPLRPAHHLSSSCTKRTQIFGQLEILVPVCRVLGQCLTHLPFLV